MRKIPVVFDTDIGTDVDDALALTLILASPELDLKGVTVVDGGEHVHKRAEMAAILLGAAGRDDVPVLVGAGHPIGAGRMPSWFGHEGKGILDIDYHGPRAVIHEMQAADWLVEYSKQERFQVIAVGPFTNVALAYKKDHGFADRLLHLTVMGGMVHEESYNEGWQTFFAQKNVPPAHLDHNTASDLEAALIIARSGIDITWVTAELTFCTYLMQDSVENIRAVGSRYGTILTDMIQVWNDERFHYIPKFPDYPSPFPQKAMACLHDPLAVASIFMDTNLVLQAHHLRFALEDSLFRVYETHQDTAEVLHQVSVRVDGSTFEQYYLDRIIHYLETIL